MIPGGIRSNQTGSEPAGVGAGPGLSRSSLVATAATGLLTGLAGSVAGKTLVFLLQVLVSRYYGPGYYGLFVTGLLTAHIMQTLSSLGVQKGGMRFLAVAHENNDISAMGSIFRFSVMVPIVGGIVVGVSCYFLAPFIAATCFRNPDLEDIIRLFSFSIPFFALLRTASDMTRAFKTAKYAVLAEDLLFPSLHIGIFVSLHALGYGFSSVIYSFIISNAICSFLIAVLGWRMVRNYAGRPSADAPARTGAIEAGIWRQLLNFSLPLLPMGLLFTLNGSIAIVMLNMLTKASDVGEYAAAARWVMLFALITLPMKLIFAPMIAGQYGINEMGKIEVLYKTSCRWMLFLTLPVFTFLLVAREPLMMIFGKGFTTSGPSVLGILLIGSLFASFVGVAADMLIMSGNQYLELACLIGGLTLNISLNLLLIPAYGVAGAAIATTASSIATDMVRILIVAGRYRIHPFSTKFATPVAIAAAIFLGDLILRSLFEVHPVGRAVLAACAVAAVVTGTLVRGLAPDDRELFLMLRQKIGKSG